MFGFFTWAMGFKHRSSCLQRLTYQLSHLPSSEQFLQSSMSAHFLAFLCPSPEACLGGTFPLPGKDPGIWNDVQMPKLKAEAQRSSGRLVLRYGSRLTPNLFPFQVLRPSHWLSSVCVHMYVCFLNHRKAGMKSIGKWQRQFKFRPNGRPNSDFQKIFGQCVSWTSNRSASPASLLTSLPTHLFLLT